MAKRVVAKKLEPSSPNLYIWAVFVDGVRRYSEGLNRSAAQRMVKQIRENLKIVE